MKGKRSMGYTLVELLIVMAVAAVLSALLLTVFARVREKGRQTTCVSNLRQIGLAVQQYVQDNDGRYPRIFDFNGGENRENQRPGSLSSLYARSSEIFWCPSSEYQLRPHHFTNYRYNLMLLNERSPSRIFAGLKESEPSDIANLIVSMDAPTPTQYRDVANSGCPARVNGWVIAPGSGYATLHSDSGNYLFADGHVKWLSPETAARMQCAAASAIARSG